MGALGKSLSLLLNFILVSAWSPSLVFAMVEGIVLVLRVRASSIPWKLLAACLCVLTAVGACAYLVVPNLQDYAEVGVASVSALVLKGWPMYPPPDAIHRYIVAYGPLTFTSRIPAFWAFGPTLFAFKLTGVLAFFTSMAGIYRVCRHYATPNVSLMGLGCCCLAFFRFVPVPYWGRGDPFILCMIVLCIWAILEAPRTVVLLAAALTFALLPNIKITAGCYLFPIVWFLIIGKGWKLAAGAVALGVLMFSLPFFSPQVSVANYWFSLNNSRHPIRIDILCRNVQYSIILLLPLLSMVRYRAKAGLSLSNDQKVYLALTLCTIATACLVGSNAGSGPHHLVPCIVPVLHLYFWLRSEIQPDVSVWASSKLAVACTVSMFVFGAVNVLVFVSTLRHAFPGPEAIAEIRRVEIAHPRVPVQVGIGSDFNDFRTFYGALTTLDGNPYTIGGLAVQELQVAGHQIPESTIQYIGRCGTPVWLIPKGDAPFSASDAYFPPDYPAFSQRFREVFLENYKIIGSGPLYDIWACSH